ncbi:MAG: hypothetical protein JNJ49_06640 [Bdellovibrionaceae bacterium]|nr:hypothetical protein [Pseudobdellovibrionaceae bacterium]
MVNTLERAFVKWISISFIVLALIVALPAFSADVFVDEGDGDFDTTPIGGPAPASEPAAPAVAQAGSDPSADMGAAPSGGPIEDLSPSADAGAAPMGAPVMDPSVAPVEEKKPVAKKAVAKKAAKKESKKAAKKAAKKSGKKSGKKSKVASTSKASKKRGVASTDEYAGGSYQVTKKECMMQTKPGSKTFIGETRADKKLWVEKSGNPNYWKVYSKDGSPAFVKKSCF